tara:strand:- start:682 stop:1605 length:924 start_codon:yes stop_codon:yes gene_type:complete
VSDKKVQKTEESSPDNKNDVMDALNEFNAPPNQESSEEMKAEEAETKAESQTDEKSEVEESPTENDKAETKWLIENKFRDDEDGRAKLAESYKNMQSLKDKAEGTLKNQESEYERLKQLDQFLKENPKVVDTLQKEVQNTSKKVNSAPEKPEDYDILDEQIDGSSSQAWRKEHDEWLIKQGAAKAMQYVDDVRQKDAETQALQAEVNQLKSMGMSEEEIKSFYGWMENPENVTIENRVKVYQILNGQVSKESNNAETESKSSSGKDIKEMSKNVGAAASVEGKSPAAKTTFDKEQENWVSSIMQFSK